MLLFTPTAVCLFSSFSCLLRFYFGNGRFSSLKIEPLQSFKVSTQDRSGWKVDQDCVVCTHTYVHTCVCLQACRWCSNALHAAYCPPRSLCGFQSSRSRVIQTIQSQSPACFSYPFLSFLCQCTISVLASLRMCYEMISYLTQRTRHQKKKKKNTHTTVV